MRRGGDGGGVSFHVGSMEHLQAEGGGVNFINAHATSDGRSSVDDAFIADDGEHGAGRAVHRIDDGDGLWGNEALAAVVDVTENLR